MSRLSRARMGLGLGACLAGTYACAPAPQAAVTQALSSAPDTRDAQDPSAGERERYLHERAFRRQTLLASLTASSNHYSRRRIASYAIETGGWDALPVWTPSIAPVVDDEGADSKPPDFTPIWRGETPQSQDEWIELGRQVFFYYPLRAEAPAAHALASPGLADRVGLVADAKGERAGVVHFIDERGQAQVGITCALCHASLVDGQWLVGRARRELDYGRMRLQWYEDTQRPLDTGLAERMADWGPGRADITDDATIDPVAIVDLWRVGDLDYLTQAGTLKQVNQSALAIRQETQILFANGQRTRPPRELMWALAQFVSQLEPPPLAADTLPSQAERERGEQVFKRHCGRCHSEATGSGALVDAQLVGTDASLANGSARGTGRYRPAPLVDLLAAAPYLHDGTVASLEALLSPRRLQPDYVDARGRTGPVLGHEYGLELAAHDHRDLLAYLSSR